MRIEKPVNLLTTVFAKYAFASCKPTGVPPPLRYSATYKFPTNNGTETDTNLLT